MSITVDVPGIGLTQFDTEEQANKYFATQKPDASLAPALPESQRIDVSPEAAKEQSDAQLTNPLDHPAAKILSFLTGAVGNPFVGPGGPATAIGNKISSLLGVTPVRNVPAEVTDKISANQPYTNLMGLLAAAGAGGAGVAKEVAAIPEITGSAAEGAKSAITEIPYLGKIIKNINKSVENVGADRVRTAAPGVSEALGKETSSIKGLATDILKGIDPVTKQPIPAFDPAPLSFKGITQDPQINATISSLEKRGLTEQANTLRARLQKFEDMPPMSREELDQFKSEWGSQGRFEKANKSQADNFYRALNRYADRKILDSLPPEYADKLSEYNSQMNQTLSQNRNLSKIIKQQKLKEVNDAATQTIMKFLGY